MSHKSKPETAINEKDNELIEIVNDFTDIVSSNKFKNNYENNDEFRNQIFNLTTMFNQFSKDLGITEYTVSDSGYSGDQVLEKYKQSIKNSWKGKREKKNNIKKITHEEILDATGSYLDRRNALLKKREIKRIEDGKEPRKLEGDVVSVYKYDKNQEEEYSSSDDDEDDIINEILGISSKKNNNYLKIDADLDGTEYSGDETD